MDVSVVKEVDDGIFFNISSEECDKCPSKTIKSSYESIVGSTHWCNITVANNAMDLITYDLEKEKCTTLEHVVILYEKLVINLHINGSVDVKIA